MDFEAPEDYIVDAFNAVVRSLPANTKIMAHCGEGYGRTGTMLAALQLQTQFDELAGEPSTIATKWGNCAIETIIPLGHFADEKEFPGSVRALTAVTKVREVEVDENKDSPGDAVEVEEQADFLNHRCVMLAKEAQNIQDSQEI